ncbi:hypothetical protein HC891_10350 [Candidatus Gracilibacteria bacterium]|nr:hypothetical protein [Candidatus Gracilibacteria bacterium]
MAFDQPVGNQNAGRFQISGNEIAPQDMVFCQYRELEIRSQPPTAGDTTPNDPPATQDGITLAVSDQPDPATPGAIITYNVTISDAQPRRFAGMALTVRPGNGQQLSLQTDSRCVMQPEGSLICNLAGEHPLGPANSETLAIPLLAAQPDQASPQFELAGFYDSSAAYPLAQAPQQFRIQLRANTTISAPPPPLASCGLENNGTILREIEARGTVLQQLVPAIFPAPGELGATRNFLSADDAPFIFVPDLISVVTFQKPVADAEVTVHFPGPIGNFYSMRAFDEQGGFIAEFRTDQLVIYGQYQLFLRGLERPIKQLVIQSKAYDDYARRRARQVELSWCR